MKERKRQSIKPHAAALAQATGQGLAMTLPEKLIQAGEEIVLTIKPGAMFIPLVSAPFIAAMAIAAMAVYAMDHFNVFNLPLQNLAMMFVCASAGRLVIGCFQWLGRTYVLTNRRMICIRGIFGINIFECPLSRIQNTILSISFGERLFSLGTILFATAGTGRLEASWDMVARPIEIHEIIIKYINRNQCGQQSVDK